MERDALARERGQIAWSELARHFARGVVVVVDPSLDLLDVAETMAKDNRPVFSDWMARGLVTRADDDHAMRWEASGQLLDAIVVAPWVLVADHKDTGMMLH